MRYLLDFGAANTGGAPAFTVWTRLETATANQADLVDGTPPTITELGNGQYWFDYSIEAGWSFAFVATLNGIELADTLSLVPPGSRPRYVLSFGSANAGGVPAFTSFVRLDTLAAVAPQPTIRELGLGLFFFDWDWTSLPSASISFKATLAGVELADVVSNPDVDPADPNFQAVGRLVARAAIQVGILKLARSEIDTFDPFASSDPLIAQMLEHLDVLGMDLASKVTLHLQQEFSIVTAGGATSYALPADYGEMVEDTQWNASSRVPLFGPVSPVYSAAVKAWNGATVTRIPYDISGARITFPVYPGDGITITGTYLSRYWIRTGSGDSSPDSDHVTASTDVVLFDPTLVVLGLKAKFRVEKGHPNAAIAMAEFEERLEWAQGAIGGAPVLSLGGGPPAVHFIDHHNLPDHIDGI